MLNEKDLNFLLYEVPSGITYTDILEDLDIQDIPQNRFNILEDIIQNRELYKPYISYRAAILLCSWGNKNGLRYLREIINTGVLGYEQNRIYGYDKSCECILNALISYWALLSTIEPLNNILIRRDIYPIIKKIICKSERDFFSVSRVFFLINNGCIEYIPLMKEYLIRIEKDKERNRYKIEDAKLFFKENDPDFLKWEIFQEAC